ncbi:MAG TPA: hypothetical protein DHW82_09540 [Spirochaetia bacterium]|nr:MAG: hypothetical protein A2Y41_01940 [Spirochaetes bacterium GWB1_36_13]HCL57233.1 hypothetical protein [Spirochaetia bacterium]
MIDIPNHDHVTRYCPKYTLDESGKPTGDSFKLRVGEEYISVDWFEYFKKINSQLTEKEIFQMLEQALIKRKFTPKKNGVFSYHNSGKVKEKKYKEIYFQVKQIQRDSSHSGIFPKPTRLYEVEMIAETVEKVILLKEI